MKRLGVIGGLGPMASAYFLELLVRMTDAATDQEHLDVTLLCRPSIPDRTAAILDKSKDSPVPMMQAAAKELEQAGACCIAVPCITSHYFFNELQPAVSIPFLHLVKETVAHLKEQGVKKAGILATTGTVSTRTSWSGRGFPSPSPRKKDRKRSCILFTRTSKPGFPRKCPFLKTFPPSCGKRAPSA